MATRPNHSGNLPRDFEPCPNCGKKGLHRYGSQIFRRSDGTLTGLPHGKRCKYCRHGIPAMTTEQLEAQLNR